MGLLKVQRKPVTANTEISFKFDNVGREFLVKNLTEGDIFIGFKAGEDNTERILLPAATAQVLSGMTVEGCDTVYIYSTVTHAKGVEVQCLSW